MLEILQKLAVEQKVRASAHGFVQSERRGFLFQELVDGLADAVVIEDYPNYHLGHAALLLQRDGVGRAIHVVWGIERGTTEPAVLVTAYHPAPAEWSADFRIRKT
ncbi:MAG: DUF4258 domain-containing protein [Hyphomicrobium aestuarii]|nr:DUF4258 domain-containing protein [Hyphomicrobium aestuarii]